MRNIARLSDNDRRELFRNTADKMGLNDAIVEKDFWVCFTLDYLFHRSPWKESITFKGGTSLSKAFHLISRFSEDIDLILDWRVLGYGKDEPWEKRSNTKQDAFNNQSPGTDAATTLNRWADRSPAPLRHAAQSSDPDAVRYPEARSSGVNRAWVTSKPTSTPAPASARRWRRCARLSCLS